MVYRRMNCCTKLVNSVFVLSCLLSCINATEMKESLNEINNCVGPIAQLKKCFVYYNYI